MRGGKKDNIFIMQMCDKMWDGEVGVNDWPSLDMVIYRLDGGWYWSPSPYITVDHICLIDIIISAIQQRIWSSSLHRFTAAIVETYTDMKAFQVNNVIVILPKISLK